MNKWTLSQYSTSQHCSQPATDVGMHGLLASQSCYHSVLPPCLSTLLASGTFLQTSLHPFDFIRNLLHLLEYGGCQLGNANNFNSLAECLNTCHVIMVSIANPCDDNNGGCSQLCLISSNSSTGYGCACSTGQHLAADGRGCLGEYDTTIMLL